MLVDQAAALRALVMEAETDSDEDFPGATVVRATTIAVTSGKGGVGKSNVSVNLAISLASLGRRVILLDADLGTANADILCDLTYQTTLAHVVAGRKQLNEVIIEAPGGFSLVPGASGLCQMAALSEYERARLVHQLRKLEDDYDFILIDTGAGLSPNVLTFIAGSDLQLVVTTPDPPAIADAYAVIKSASRRIEKMDVHVLVNMVRNQREAEQTFARLEAVCGRFLDISAELAGFVLHDQTVIKAVRTRKPFMIESPRCPASVCITRLAHRIDGTPQRQGKGMLRRVFGFLSN